VPERAPQQIRTFSITAVAANRRRLFQTDANANLMIQLLTDDRAKGRYQIHAFVLMPDHIHLLITPAPNVSIEKAMQFIKGGFSFRLKSKMPVWEDSFMKRRIEDARDFDAHRDYIHANPVRAHLAENPEDFPFSSAHARQTADPAPAHLRA
jgi:putative transposase